MQDVNKVAQTQEKKSINSLANEKNFRKENSYALSNSPQAKEGKSINSLANEARRSLSNIAWKSANHIVAEKGILF